MNKNVLAAKIRYGLATQDELESVSRDDLFAIKSDDSSPHFRFSDGLVEKAAGDTETREHEHVLSTERRDTMGDIIRVAGWDLERVKSALPVFYAHDSRDIPIGVMKRAWKGTLPDGTSRSSERANDKALLGRYSIHTADTFGDGAAVFGAKAEAVQALLEARAIRGGSVGFMPVQTYKPKTAEEATELGLGTYGVLFEKQHLMEWSITPIPANPDAQKYRSAAQESRAAGTAVLKGLVDEGRLLPDAAELLLDSIFSEDAYSFLEAEEKTAVAMDDWSALVEVATADDAEPETEPQERSAEDLELEGTVELEQAAEAVEPRNTGEEAAAKLAETLEKMTQLVAHLTDVASASVQAQKHILEQFEEIKKRAASPRDQGGEDSADGAEVDAPEESGSSRSDDPEGFAESVLRDALAGLKTYGAKR
jgi:hypothetical protein